MPDGSMSAGVCDRAWRSLVAMKLDRKQEGRAKAGSFLHSDAAAEDAVHAYPTIDAATVVSNLKTTRLPRFDQVQVLGASHLAEHNIPDFQLVLSDWCDGAKIS
ncbi:hypothetical protein [Verrucomicrobium sp. BvORR106]|uniref:hypothetical protein n=1 Tax=Verrucomicrobium sp. BvORR106 TaxID=1403819 RepID=UPI002240F5C7|nr:hypothetical protein [Verrucomicrobium sp. BvORR106]